MMSFLNIIEGSIHNDIIFHQGHIIKILALLTFYALYFLSFCTILDYSTPRTPEKVLAVYLLYSPKCTSCVQGI